MRIEHQFRLIHFSFGDGDAGADADADDVLLVVVILLDYYSYQRLNDFD